MNIEGIYKIYANNYIVDTDTRSIRKGAVFFALKGGNFNGNKFAQEALEKGASYAVIDEKEYFINDRTILVNDVLKTLQELANYHRNKLAIPIVGLTGSNGKTTTKELIYSVLSKKYNVVATKGNLNNHIGVPLTLLSMNDKTEIGVVEMGANNHGEIAMLSRITNPTYGYITNFGKAHLEGFGSVEGVIKAKSELYDFLRENNKIVIVNPNDEIQSERTKKIHRVLFDESLKYISSSPYVILDFLGINIKSNLIGKYNYTNICAAITIGKVFKLNIEKIKEAIEEYVPKNNRSQIIEKNNLKVILDAYNANPTSMKNALESFSEQESDFKIVVLGDMFELGRKSLEEHQIIADLVSSYKFNYSFLVGEHFNQVDTTLIQNKTFEEFRDSFKGLNLSKNTTILVKGSRGMALERVIELL
ncbi:UDP-N-acetylmuramoyl-tripeptide--D-alanyl-D-alanine ligase [Tenacibaculum sp. 190524A02b]|uniref:UDP-N-acetylmuramoyl-tripeptide--D-alanyl-D-alanine ligase n=1 Tax=Tenacibaculum vairaonense TaxID=3137860 RepID=A0ABM9PJS8_9FLAO